ncbi:MAG: radical SAM protein [Spirochaetes bacterium]|nr:radical SAM protein [Spirochaetota bacterium]
MRILLVQPPFVQFNSPYPAIHYLEAFLREGGHEVEASDHAAGLYRAIFCRAGLERVFADAEIALSGRPAPDGATAAALERYFAHRERYLALADGIMDFLCDGDPAVAHFLANERLLPRGSRLDALLSAEGGPTGTDFARAAATRILDDLGDFVSYALDPEFGTVRYAERIASGRGSYADARAAADGWLMERFYRPWLRGFFASRTGPGKAPALVGISIPFPGCLVGAIAAAGEARRALGDSVRIAAGGGYVTTELRLLRDGAIFRDFDRLVFDSGYGGLASVVEELEGGSGGLYRVMRAAADGSVERCAMPEDAAPRSGIVACRDAVRFAAIDERALRETFPDYRHADFGRLPRVADSTNPMHRLWNDAPWLKYRLAHGCYWRKCAFCDVGLDYVGHYVPSDVGRLMSAASAAAERTGLSGIHFVDEAMPLPSMLAFARLNRTRRKPFSFWGNVRFDRFWNDEVCAFLADSGLVAVSGGIEIATERGLGMTDKGITLAVLARSLLALGRSGILVHAYLIYGFPGQTDADIADSMDVVRQFFAAGLVDSAYWHRFTLTRHSRMYREWACGERPELVPVDLAAPFASNDLGFEGGERFDRWTAPLDSALSAWMDARETDGPVSSFLPKGFPKPSVPPDLVARLAGSADAELKSLPPKKGGRAYWLGSTPSAAKAGHRRGDSDPALSWEFRGEPELLAADAAGGPEALRRLAAALRSLAATPDGLPFAGLPALPGIPAQAFEGLRRRGLVVV